MATKYQEYKLKARKLDALYRVITAPNHTVFTIELPDGSRAVVDKTEGTFKVYEAME